MSKPNDLRTQLAAKGERRRVNSTKEALETPPKYYTPPSRQGKVIFSFALTPEERDAIRRVALDNGMKVQEWMRDIIEDGFRKYGRKPLSAAEQPLTKLKRPKSAE